MEEINYSDGDIEKKILKIIKDPFYKREEIEIKYQDNWPIKYHFSNQRTNLLKHLDFSGLEVLELGGGMGAISEYLVERCKHLTIIEGTKNRSDVIKERLAKFTNFELITGNFQDFKSEKKYDVVTLIGVLEYSELFIDDEKPFDYVMNYARNLLKPGGALLVAIENKNGLKYWKGCTEDHSGLYFDGICNYKSSKAVKTLSRHELRELTFQSGFKNIKEYFPWPDYKLPNTVISGDLCLKYPDLAADLAKITPGANIGQTDLDLFPERLVLENLSNSNLLEDFSNSFLFACEFESGDTFNNLNKNLNSGELAWHYSPQRKVKTKTVFKEQNKTLVVEKDFVEENIPSIERFGSRIPFKEKYIEGKKVFDILLRQAFYNEWELFLKEFKAFLFWSLKIYKIPDTDFLKGESIDALTHNSIKKESGYEFFDLEWTSKEPVLCDYFIFRNILMFQNYSRCFYSTRFDNFFAIYHYFCVELGVVENFEICLKKEADLFRYTLKGASENIEIHLKEFFLRSFKELSPYITNQGSIPLPFEELSQTKQELSQTKQELSQTKQELVLHLADIQNIYSSRSWRFMAPVRKLANILR